MKLSLKYASLSLFMNTCTAFMVHPGMHKKSLSIIHSTLLGATTSRRSPLSTPLASASSPVEGEEREREFARVRRRRGRREEEDGEADGGQDYTTQDDSTYEQRRQRRQDTDSAAYNNDDWIDYDSLDDLLDDDDNDGYFYDEEDYDLLSNVLIPNPLLDSMDPDGAAERFPELASDPRFWFDMVLFVAFLNFLSFAGPQDPFPDIPWY